MSVPYLELSTDLPCALPVAFNYIFTGFLPDDSLEMAIRTRFSFLGSTQLAIVCCLDLRFTHVVLLKQPI